LETTISQFFLLIEMQEEHTPPVNRDFVKPNVTCYSILREVLLAIGRILPHKSKSQGEN